MKKITEIEIDTNTSIIHNIFGYKTEEEFLEVLVGDGDKSKKTKHLTWLFMELIKDNIGQMYMGYLMGKILSIVTGLEVDNPAKIIDYINKCMTDEELERLFIDGMTVSMQIFGEDGKPKGMDEIVKGIMNGKEGK